MGFKVRMGILGTILVVALCGLAWEYLVVLPGFNKAQEQLSELSDANIKASKDDGKTLVDVKGLVKQTPSDTKLIKPVKKADVTAMSAMFFVRHDKYNYYHALPWKKPQTITVVYRRPISSVEEADKDPESFEDSEWRFWAVHFNEDPPTSRATSTIKNGETPARALASGMGGGGGGPPTPEQDFARLDTNKDGKLSGDEINDAVKTRMDKLDPDKNGEITKEEYVEVMKLEAPKEGVKSNGKKKGRGGRKGKGGKSSRPDDDDADKKATNDGDSKGKEKGTSPEPQKTAPDKEESEKDDAKPEDSKKADVEKVDPKAEGDAKAEPKKAEADKAETPKTESKNDEAKQEESKKEEPKKAESDK